MDTTIVLPAEEYRRNRKAWLEARKAGLGASESAAVLGVDPWRTPLDVYLEKVNPEVRDENVSEAAEWGSAIEAVVARKVGTRHPKLGRMIPTPGLCAHPQHPWMLATPDRLLVDRQSGREAVLEIKTTDGRNKPLWDDGPPERVQVQVQQQLAVLGLEVGYVAVLFGGREMPDPYEIKRDDEVIDQLITLGASFWRDHVLAQIPPEPRIGDDGNLLAMFPGDELLDAYVADDSLAALLSERSVIAQRIKNHEAAIAERMEERQP